MKRMLAYTLILIMTFATTAMADDDLGQLLESGIYQEQTVGDLDAAIKCYQQVVEKNASNRKLAAQALYRLIQCYLKQNKPDEARKAMETLTADYAQFQEIITQARKLLPDILQVGDVPWPNNERMALKLRSHSGMELGAIYYSARQTKHDFQGGLGRHNDGGFTLPVQSNWLIQSHMAVPVSNLTQYTAVFADEKTFAPIQGITSHSMLGRFIADYKDQKVELQSTSNTGKSIRTFDVTKRVFDNEQVIYLIRRLPLAKDYQATFPIFPVTSGQLVECQINVVARENVEAIGRQIDCWKVDLKVKTNGVTALNHQLWYSVEKPHLLVKYDSGNAVMLLDDVRIQPNNPTAFQVTKDVTLSQPVDWQFYQSPNPGQYKASVSLLSNTQTWGMFLVSEKTGTAIPLETLVKQDVKTLESYFTDYKVQASSWKEHKISGMDAITYVADYKDKHQQMVEYRTYLASNSHIMWFVFRTEKDRFEANRKVYDQIIESLDIKTQASHSAVSQFPTVLSTSPITFATDVDPLLTQLSVTFDLPMVDKSWSWTGGGETFPVIKGEISYDAKRMTCTLPVKLKPATVYWVGINSPSHRNFKSIDGKPAKRYVILFATRDEHGNPTAIPEDMLKRVQTINQVHQVLHSKAIVDKHQLMNWVDKFFTENFRDIAGRKKLEWGTPAKGNDGMLSIRYKYRAMFTNNQCMILDQLFTFTPEGKFVSVETIEKTPVALNADE